MVKLKDIVLVGALASVGAFGFVVPVTTPERAAPETTTTSSPAIPGTATARPAPATSSAGSDGSVPAPAPEPAAAPAPEPALESYTGSASYYADKFEGRTTASGVPFRQSKLWAAHKTLPFGTRLRVTNLANGQEIEVEVVDRGPYAHGRILDLSRTAANRLDFIRAGHTRVRVEVLEKP